MSNREPQDGKINSVSKLIHSTLTNNSNTKNIKSLRRSVSPNPPKTKVSLLQNRIIDKLNRSHSDLTHESRSAVPRSHSGLTASRLIHSVRRSSSTNQLTPSALVPTRPSFTSPARSIDRLYSSPDLVSPRVVKKALSMGNVIRHKSNTSSQQQNHKIQVKLEVTKPSSSSSSTSAPGSSIRKSKEILTLKSTSVSEAGGTSGETPTTTQSTTTSHKKSKKNNGKNGSTGASSSSKLPKSVKISNTVSVQNGNSHTIPLNQSSSANGSSLPVKPPRKTKISSSSSKSEKSSSNNKHNKSSSSSSTTPSSSTDSANVSQRHAGCLVPAPPPQPTPPTDRSSSSSRPTSPFRSAAAVATTPIIKTSQVKVLSTSSRSTSRSPTPLTTTTTQSVNTSRKSQSKHTTTTPTQKPTSGLAKVLNKTSGTKTSSKKPSESTKMQTGSSNTKPTSDKSVLEKEAVEVQPVKKPHRRCEQDLSYLTIPLIRKYHLESIYSSSRSLNSYKSLPTLTPYLAETRRVSNSIFLTRSPSPSPSVRPTKTSLMREIICREPTIQTTNLITTKESSGGIKRISDSLQTIHSCATSMRSQSPTHIHNIMHNKTSGGGDSHVSRSRRRRSVSCLNLRDYTQYILQLRHSYRNRSPRFTQLHRLYSSLDRLCQLERSTSSLYDIPVLSSSKRHDFDAWWKVRNRLRIEQEMNLISKQLLQAQSEREFFFRPKILENYRWHPDSGLRFKKWSVEELKIFMLHGELPKTSCSTTGNPTGWDDLYKTHWRGTSVKELALNLEVAELYKKQTQMHDAEFYENRIPFLRRAFSMSSTLSEEQREGIKKRIGTLITKQNNSPLGGGGGTQSGRESRNRDRIVTTRMGFTYSSDSRRSMNNDLSTVASDGLSESAKKELSRSLSKEFKERKVKETNLLRDTFVNQKISSNGTSTITLTEHLPISTKIALRKAEAQLNNKVKAKTVPFYSVYCKDGVNNRIKVFEKSGNDAPGEKVSATTTGGSNITNKLGKSRELLFSKPTATTAKAEVQGSEGPGNKEQTFYRSKSPMSLPPFRSISPRRSPSPPIGKRRPITPDRLTKEYVSHVNIISKLASLLLKRNTSLKNLVTREVLERDKLERLRSLNYGEVERLRDYFEANDEDFCGIKSPEINLLRCLFCSDSNLAKITERLDEDHKRRCASAMEIDNQIINTNKQENSNSKRLRPAPDGSSSSPTPPTTTNANTNTTTNALYLSTRSRKPIYQPSSTPNVCQPTLTAHCYLSQSDSIERLEEPSVSPCTNNTENNYDSLGSYYRSQNSYSSPAPSSLSSYYPTVGLALGGSNQPITQQRRILDERLTNNTNASKNFGNKGYSYSNYDPSAHQPKYRYVPKPPVLMEQHQMYKYHHHSLSPPPPLPQGYQDYYRCGSSLSSLPNTFVVNNMSMGYGLPPPPPPFNKGASSMLRRSESFHSTILGRAKSPPPPAPLTSSSFRNMGAGRGWNWTRAVQQQQQNKQQQHQQQSFMNNNNNEGGFAGGSDPQLRTKSSNFARIVSTNASSITSNKPSSLASFLKNVPQETSV